MKGHSYYLQAGAARQAEAAAEGTMHDVDLHDVDLHSHHEDSGRLDRIQGSMLACLLIYLVCKYYRHQMLVVLKNTQGQRFKR